MKKWMIIAALAALAFVASAESRVWTQVNGETLEGEFKELKDAKGKMTVFIIQKEDGKVRGIPLTRLTEEDQAVAKQLAGE